VQEPSLLHLPPEIASLEAGKEAVDLAESVGLHLDPWQRLVVVQGLAERADWQWAAFECGVETPRQNGKDAILEAVELAGLFLFEEMLIVHSAHKFDTAQEHFLRIQNLIDGSSDLSSKVKKISIATGREAIVLMSGARLKFIARSRGAARGFTGDRLILNEAFALFPEAVGAMLPALSAVANPQVWYGSSSPHSDSEVLHQLRNRAQSADAGRLFYAGWNNEPGVSPTDREAWARANPALGIRITEEFIEAEFAAIGHLGDEFARERLGIPSALDSGVGVFPPGVWAACVDEGSVPLEPAFALDVAPGHTFASFGAAARRADGLVHVELLERHPGTDWVIGRAAEKAKTIALDPRGPAGALLEPLKRAGVAVVELPDGQMPRTCVLLQNLVVEGKVRHFGQRELDAAVAGAAISPAGDAWRWSRSHSSVDISPLVVVTVALWHLNNVRAPSKYWSADELWSEG
jgi:phage terminase large subunit-like protein